MKAQDIKFYIQALKSPECQCGHPKKYKSAFCYPCYCQLPDYMQKELYRPVRAGFEKAYDNALQFFGN